ncbi:hypothetical protein [Azospirillum sp. SYSU D00513]|uniref:hypothetical protein n=1 Tax=Azospirillum sp. SYSU D00513 TaxID=2812561 RepID=UPI001A957CF9|nr:hypothetical protein [Azospirillum sp. SYSU D00513]
MSTESLSRPSRPARRSKTRTLVPLAGLLGVAITTTALIGMFGLYYAHKSYLGDMRRVEMLLVRLDEARGAQVHFKKQVQEWKNLLLRGGDDAQYERYLAAFREEDGRVADLLGRLAEGTDGEAPSAAAAGLREAHRAVSVRYGEALATHPREALARADQELRGVDRTLDAELNVFADGIRDEVFAVRRTLETESTARYDGLRRVATWGLVACVLLVGLFLRAAIRRERDV